MKKCMLQWLKEKKTVLQKIDERKRKRKILAEKNKELRWKKKTEKK